MGARCGTQSISPRRDSLLTRDWFGLVVSGESYLAHLLRHERIARHAFGSESRFGVAAACVARPQSSALMRRFCRSRFCCSRTPRRASHVSAAILHFPTPVFRPPTPMNDTVDPSPDEPGSRDPEMPSSLSMPEQTTNAVDLQQLCEQFYPLVQQRVHRMLARDIRRQRAWLGALLSTGDVVHDVFLGVVRDHGQLRGRSDRATIAYLGRLVRNRLIDTVRHHQASRRDARLIARDVGDCSRPQRSPAAEAVHAEEMAQFHRALAEFEERERAILQARLEDRVRFDSLAKTFGYASADSARKAFHTLQARLVTRMQVGRGQ